MFPQKHQYVTDLHFSASGRWCFCLCSLNNDDQTTPRWIKVAFLKYNNNRVFAEVSKFMIWYLWSSSRNLSALLALANICWRPQLPVLGKCDLGQSDAWQDTYGGVWFWTSCSWIRQKKNIFFWAKFHSDVKWTKVCRLCCVCTLTLPTLKKCRQN